MSTKQFPKPQRQGWRFLREGERVRKRDRYQWGLDGTDTGDMNEADLYAVSRGPTVPSGVAYFTSGYIRRISKRTRKTK